MGPWAVSHQWSGEALEEVDFIVETDGGRYHGSRRRRRRDAAKAARFASLGWHVWWVPELSITLDRSGVTAHLARLGRELSAGGRQTPPTA